MVYSCLLCQSRYFIVMSDLINSKLNMTFKKLILFSLLLFVHLSASAKETLIFVFDVIRHGDRTPLHVIPKVPYVWPQGLGELTPEGMQQEFQRGVAFRKEYVD